MLLFVALVSDLCAARVLFETLACHLVCMLAQFDCAMLKYNFEQNLC